MRILLLILQFPPDVNSTGLLMDQLAQGLMRQGHRVDVITTFPHYEHFRVWDEYRGRLRQWDRHAGMRVLRTWVYANGRKQQMLHRLFSYLSFNALATLAGVLRRDRFDVILCTNGGFFSGFSSGLIGLTKGIPFVYNVQDLYPETPVAAGQLTNRRAIAGLEAMEKLMYRWADHVTVITPSFKESLVGKGVPPEKVTVIPNFVDTDFIQPLPKVNPFSQRTGLADRFVVTHAGNVGYVYDLETMLEAAALLKDEPEILFLINGEGVAKPSLQEKAGARGLRNVWFWPYQPRQDVPWLRAASDVQVSLYRPGAGRYSMASKIYEIMASGRPLLSSADRDSDVWRLVEETGCGLNVDPLDPRALADAVLQLYRDPAAREAMAQRGRAAAVASYSTQAVVARYADLLQRVGRSDTLK